MKMLRIAYTLQNVGGVNFLKDVGDSSPVKYSIQGLKSRGHKVDVFRLGQGGILKIENPYENISWNELGGPVDNPILKWSESAVRRVQSILRLPYFAFFDSFKMYHGLRRVLAGYDLCHEHNGLFSVGASLACARMGFPYMLTFSADPIMELDFFGKSLTGLHRKVAERQAAATYRRAGAILCVSNQARVHLVDHWGVDAEKVHVMPNGVDVELFRPGPKNPDVLHGLGFGKGPIITFLGGFQPWHGIDLLLESFCRVLQSGREANLLLIGDGIVRSKVENEVRRMNIEGRVRITGLLPQTEVPELLENTDIAVIPYPKFPKDLWFSPLKLYEYMAAGKAILATNHGQIAEVIEDQKTGLLVEPGNVDAITAGLVQLLDMPALRDSLGNAARRQAVERHSWRHYIHGLEAIYSRLLEDHEKI